MVFTNGQNGNTLTGGQVGNNLGNPYYAASGRFYHADGHYNGFYTWNTLPTSNVNANSYVTASSTLGPTSYNQPKSIISDGNTGIFLVDTYANRVLHYHQIPTTLVAPDSVVGQPNLTTGAYSCSAAGLGYPYDVALATNAKALLVADSGSGRVVVYSPIPFTSDQAAIMAIGQSSLTSCSGATSASRLSANGGYAKRLWTDGIRLAVSDTLAHRVLIFNSVPTLLQNGVSGPAADIVIGQPTFFTFGNPRSNPNAYTLYSPSHITSDGTQLMISDGGSNRALIYGSYPTASTPGATSVLGQTTMTTGTSGFTTASLTLPSGMLLANNFLFVGDPGNGRFVIYLSQ